MSMQMPARAVVPVKGMRHFKFEFFGNPDYSHGPTFLLVLNG